MAGAVKVTVIATGFDKADAVIEEPEEEPRGYAAQRGGRTPFLRGDDSGGFGTERVEFPGRFRYPDGSAQPDGLGPKRGRIYF